MNKIILVLFVALLTTALALASSEDSRKIEIENKGDEIRIKATSEGDVESRIEFELEHLSGGQGLAEGDLRFYIGNSSDDGVRYRFKLFTVTEFTDANDNGLFDSGETTHTVYSTDSSGPRSWRDFDLVNTTTSNGAILYSFTAVTEDGVLTLRGYMAEAVDSSNLLFNPDSVKIDVEVRNFPWTGPSSTKLALVSRLLTTLPATEDSSDNKITVSNPDSAFLGEFTWADKASANGTDVAVVASKVADGGTDASGDTEYNINFVFNSDEHKDEYLWDPSMSVSSPAASIVGSLALSFLF